MRVYEYTLFTGRIDATSSIARDYPSSAQSIDFTFGYSVQATYTGIQPQGTLSLLSSNDDVNFVTIRGSSAYIAGASSGTTIWNVRWPNYDSMRVNFSSTSASSGNLVVTFFSKGG